METVKIENPRSQNGLKPPSPPEPMRNGYALFLLFFASFLLLAFIFYKDFGVTWDEGDFYLNGATYYGHFTREPVSKMLLGAKGEETYFLYSAIYSCLLFALNPAKIVNLNAIYFNHLLNILFGSILFVAAFFMLRRHWKGDGYLAFWGPLFIFLTPRLLGNFAFDPKDMPFAIAYFVSLGAIYALGGKKNVPVKILVLGLLFGFTQSLRILGISLALIWFFYEAALIWAGKPENGMPRKPAYLNLVLILCCVFLVSLFAVMLCWPYVGSNFFLNFGNVLASAKKFPWKEPVLYFGNNINPADLPWHYLPVWFLISTPVFVIFHFLASFRVVDSKKPLFILLTLSLVVNLGLYLFLHPLLYDGLRHYLFLLPVVCLLAAMSFGEFWTRMTGSLFHKAIVGLSFLFMALTAYHTVALHPYQYAYFNELIGGIRGADKKFETDYWGASYKEAAEWLQKNECTDQNRKYCVHSTANPFQSWIFFPGNMQWCPENAEYNMSITRWNLNRSDGRQPLYVVTREGVPLNYVYRMK
jgi:hypothetical protein